MFRIESPSLSKFVHQLPLILDDLRPSWTAKINSVTSVSDAAQKNVQQTAETPLIIAFVRDPHRAYHADRVDSRLQFVMPGNVLRHRVLAVIREQVALPVREMDETLMIEDDIDESLYIAAIGAPVAGSR